MIDNGCVLQAYVSVKCLIFTNLYPEKKLKKCSLHDKINTSQASIIKFYMCHSGSFLDNNEKFRKTIGNWQRINLQIVGVMTEIAVFNTCFQPRALTHIDLLFDLLPEDDKKQRNSIYIWFTGKQWEIGKSQSDVKFLVNVKSICIYAAIVCLS